jgi:60 kDa SS-A/Ro ribonucleoprotein
MRGSSTWAVVNKIVNALDECFYLSFGAVEPTGKRICIALDVSGSMTNSMIGNMNLSARAASSAMAMVTARSEKNYEVIGFTSGGKNFFSANCSSRPDWGYGRGRQGVSVLDISPRRRLDDIVAYTDAMDFGATDCALPMIWASANNLKFDAFIVYTDNETWSGDIHPFQALKNYRDKTGINARLIAVGMTTTEYSIADPSDKGMMNVVGFDTAAPNVMSAFIRGDF